MICSMKTASTAKIYQLFVRVSYTDYFMTVFDGKTVASYPGPANKAGPGYTRLVRYLQYRSIACSAVF